MTKEEAMTELKPCPFCGGEAELVSSIESWVRCKDCGAMTNMKACDAGAIEEWNRRVNDNTEGVRTMRNTEFVTNLELYKKPEAQKIEIVKHAEWVERPEFPDWEYCSNCGTGTRRIYREYDEEYHIWSEDRYGYQYCPHCGAKMDGGKTE